MSSAKRFTLNTYTRLFVISSLCMYIFMTIILRHFLDLRLYNKCENFEKRVNSVIHILL